MKKVSMTLEKLARIVVDGFTANKKQFQQIDKKFAQADAKLDHEIGNLAAVVKRGFDHVEEQFEEVDRRFDGIDGRLQHLGNRLDTVVTHERRITRIEKKVGIPTVD